MPKNTTNLKASVQSRQAKLAFGSRGAYSIESLESGQFTEKELRQEYSRLRSIALKRFQRLESSEFANEGTVPYNYRPEQYPTLRNMEEGKLPTLLRDLAAVVSSRRSTIYGLQDIRSESVETIHEHGISWVTEANWKSFGEFMKQARAMTIGRMFDSDRAVDIFVESTYAGNTSESLYESFQSYLDEMDAQVEAIPEVRR